MIPFHVCICMSFLETDESKIGNIFMQHLLSSSKDETVRLWQVGSDECLSIFLHSNYGKHGLFSSSNH